MGHTIEVADDAFHNPPHIGRSAMGDANLQGTTMNKISKTTSAQHADQTTSQNQIVIYASGICPGSRGPGGYAATLRRQDENGELKKLVVQGGSCDTTINRMSMEAAISAIGSIRKFRHVSITVCSENQILIRGMTEWLAVWQANGWKASGKQTVQNRDLWERLVALVEGLDIEWVWVPSSSCDPMIEETKELANEEGRKARVRSFKT